MKINKRLQGKRNRDKGRRFEALVRKDLEKNGWIISRWMNNVEFFYGYKKIETGTALFRFGKLVPAKRGIFGLSTTGFPDLIAFKKIPFEGEITQAIITKGIIKGGELGSPFKLIVGDKEVIGVECKSNGFLSREEKEKCRWLIQNNIFSKILIVSKGKKRGEIIYKEFGKNGN